MPKLIEMVYFVKRNDKLQEYKDYYQKLERLCYFLDHLNPDLEKCRAILTAKKKGSSLLPLGEYLAHNHHFDFEGFLKLHFVKDDAVSNQKVLETLKNSLGRFKACLDKLKSYESFQGRIKFGQFEKLFNFENYIYEDKQFKYSTISSYNKRLIPEFVASAFAHMIYHEDVDEKIRRNMEQYFVAIMSNMDYQNFAHIAQLKNELKNDLPTKFNFCFAIGVAPLMFDDTEYVKLINERMIHAEQFVADTKDTFRSWSRTKFWKRSLNSPYSTHIKIPDNIFWGNDRFALDDRTSEKPYNLTIENLNKIYDAIKSENPKFEKYNLVIVTSTFHIIKTAIELEKLFYNKEEMAPTNVIFVGDEKFYTLAHNQHDCHDPNFPMYHKKKLKSLIYELFLHALDKNLIK